MPEGGSGFGVVKQGLTKKVGPLQAWQWGLVAGAGYIAYRVISGKGWSLSGDAANTAATSEAAYAGGVGGGYTITLEDPSSGSTPATPAIPADDPRYGAALLEIERLRRRADYYKQGKLAQKKRAAGWKKVATRKATKKPSRKVRDKQPSKRAQTAVRKHKPSFIGGAAFRPKPPVKVPEHRIGSKRPSTGPRRPGATPGGPMLNRKGR